MAQDRVERRLAAILAADVVGYSRLIRADEEGVLAALNWVCVMCWKVASVRVVIGSALPRS